LCDEKIAAADGWSQDGPSGRALQSFQRILEPNRKAVPRVNPEGFSPDGISVAKSLGAGFPMGAFWVREPYADLLSAGTHGTTYGGSPLSCAVGLKVLEVIQREKLADNVRRVGDFLKTELASLVAAYPHVLRAARGLGFMLGIELAPNIHNLQAIRTQSKPFVSASAFA
jgi:acetylornithine aminotransferase/acetylornithine/N-succinyldiaminopimelate aminotransferase